MSLGSFAELGAKLLIAEKSMEFASEVSLAEYAALVADVARDAIGTYEFGWTPLAAATIARKGADTPLLETGRLRDSIGYVIASPKEAFVGTNDPNARYHEFGTTKIPPRPFLAGALAATQNHIPKIFGKNVKRALSAGKSELAELRELIHILKDVGHEVKELGKSITDDPER